jgi:magnesium-transporting ATPase (P-type)
MNSILGNGNNTRGQSPEIVQLLLRLGKSAPEQALKEMRTSESGLTSSEAERRLAQYGENKVIQEKPTSWVIQFIKASLTPFNLIFVPVTKLFLSTINRNIDFPFCPPVFLSSTKFLQIPPFCSKTDLFTPF